LNLIPLSSPRGVNEIRLPEAARGGRTPIEGLIISGRSYVTDLPRRCTENARTEPRGDNDLVAVIRRMGLGDVEEVLKMRSSLDTLYAVDRPGPTMTLEDLTPLARGPEMHLRVLVAEVEGKVVGFIDYVIPRSPFMPLKDAVYIGELFVKPEHRRRGLGRALVQRVIQLARENADKWKARRVVTNAGDRAFYERLGFTPMEKPQRETVPMWSHEYLLT